MRIPVTNRFGCGIVLALALATLSGCAREGPPAPVDGSSVPTMQSRPTAAGAGEIRVARGDSLYALAKRLGVPVRDIIDLNSLQPPYKLVEGQKLRLPAARFYKVVAGDTVYGISRATGVDAASLMRLNGMKPPFVVQTGQLLRLPAAVQVASTPRPRPTAAPAATPFPARPGTPTSPMPPIPPNAPPAAAQAPAQGRLVARIEAPTGGVQQLPMPGGQTGSPRPVPGGAQPVPALPPLPGDEAQPQGRPAATPPADATMAAPQPDASEAPAPEGVAPPTQTAGPIAPPPPRTGGLFSWPTVGKLISGYGPSAGGLHNDGINIEAPVGTPVTAAEAGVVAYAGNELRGFGNLLLVRHQGGWMTAYAHNNELLVKRGQKVLRGQMIARVGRTGNVESPQLHFEIRKGTDAIDPVKFLGAPPNSISRAEHQAGPPGPG